MGFAVAGYQYLVIQKRFMADNGGEFVNSEFIELCEKFNIHVQNSAAESPFSNHRMLVEMLTKTKEDVHCSWEVALSWALSAKNSMQMFGGFSAFQLTMGRNPALPNIIDNKLPALEESTVGKTVSENIAAMISSREAFVKCESSNKIKRALCSQVRTCNYDYFDIGEKVFYKRKDSEKCHGPGAVLGRESQSIVVKHGNQYIKVYPCHTTKYPKECNDGNKNASLPVGVSAECGTVKKIVQIVQEVNSSNSGYLEHGETSSTQTAESTPAMNDSNTVVVTTEPEVSQPVDNLTDKDTKTNQLPKPKMHIQFLLKYPEEDADSDSWIRAYVHSRAGKASGKYANCFNIQLEGDNDVKCVDWTELALDWKKDNNTSEREEEVLLSSVIMYDQSVVDAQQAELTKFKQNNVYEEVDDIGQSTVGVRWVITQKPEGPMKARLVALGFQESSNEIRKTHLHVTRIVSDYC